MIKHTNLDIGQVILNSDKQKSKYLDAEELSHPTGFFDSISELLKKKKEHPSGGIVNTIVIEDTDDNTNLEYDSASNSSEEEHKQLYIDVSNNEVDEVDEKDLHAEEIYYENIKKKNQWKEGLSFSEIRRKYENQIIDLCLIKTERVWTLSRAKKDENLRHNLPSYYYGSSLAGILNEEILDFVDYVTPTDHERYLRRDLIAKISEAVRICFSDDVKVHVFGSNSTNLYLPNSDLDLVLLSDTQFGRVGDKVDVENYYKLAEELEKQGLVFSESLQIITKAKVPLIKFTDTIVNINVDISFNLKNGIEAAKIVNSFLVQHPALRPLALVLKQFLVKRGLNEVFSGGLGSYGLIGLIVSFLQLHPLVQSKAIKQEENVGLLLLDFLEYYGKFFNNDKVGIRLSNGGEYFCKGKLGAFSNYTKRDSLTIHDPEDDDNDITRGSFNYRLVRKAFAAGFNILSGAMLEVYDTHMKELKEQSNSALKKRRISYGSSIEPLTPTNFRLYSLLGTILDFDEFIIAHRRKLSERFFEAPV